MKDMDKWTLPFILEDKAEKLPNKAFLQFKDGPEFSFREVNETVNSIAHGLENLGVKKGDRVLIMLPNSLEFVYTWFAINKLGAIEVPVHTAYKGYYLEHAVNCSQGQIMVVDAKFLEVVKASENNMPGLKKLVVWQWDEGKEAPGFERLEVLPFNELYSGVKDNPGVDVSYNDIAVIMFTSGTTGPSKGAMIPHRLMFKMAYNSIHDIFKLTPEDVFMIVTPLHHSNAQWVQLCASLMVGCKAVIYDRFSASSWLDWVRKSKATVTVLIGVMSYYIFTQPEKPDDANNPLRAILCQPIPHEIADQFRKRFNVKLIEGFGLTETGYITVTPHDAEWPRGSCGKALEEWFDVKIVNPETDEEVPTNCVGEIVVRPKVPWTLTTGYYGMPEKTAEAFRNLWFHTGDALRRDENGYYYFVDRIKDYIRVKGENISSYETERIVNSHPAVLESAAIAVKSDYIGGEDELKICVVLKPGAKLTPEELLDYLQDRMPRFTIPRYVEFMESLPKTPTEKVQKYKLREAGVTNATWDRVKAGYQLKR